MCRSLKDPASRALAQFPDRSRAQTAEPQVIPARSPDTSIRFSTPFANARGIEAELVLPVDSTTDSLRPEAIPRRLANRPHDSQVRLVWHE
jgi:hypothetical protein